MCAGVVQFENVTRSILCRRDDFQRKLDTGRTRTRDNRRFCGSRKQLILKTVRVADRSRVKNIRI